MSTSDSRERLAQGVAGYFYDGQQSARVTVTVRIIGREVMVDAPTLSRVALLRDVEVSDRIGNTPRFLRFRDGASCELLDNDAVDAALEAAGTHAFARHVSRAERAWRWVIAALMLVVVGSWAGITYGIPALAKQAAHAIPLERERWLGEKVLAQLDGGWLKPSGLPPARQAVLKGYLTEMGRSIGGGRGFRLELRAGGSLRANAFALPGGIVVMTDELVEIAANDEELKAVMAHEVGHVMERHSLRSLLQNSATAALVASFTGDISSVVAVAPTVLLHAKYSRDFERAADVFAFRWLDSQHISRQRFADILERLEKKYGGVDYGYLSSHPRTSERVNGARD
jgi:predicted Zn-dependent protease